MRNLAELNINEGGKAVERPAPSREDIVEFEQAFGVSLLPGLSFLLQASNGGHPEFDAVGGPEWLATGSCSRYIVTKVSLALSQSARPTRRIGTE